MLRKVSSEVTKVPLAKLRKLFVMESKVVGVHGEERREEDGEVQEEVKGEIEELREKRSCAWREDGMTDSRDLEPMWV